MGKAGAASVAGLKRVGTKIVWAAPRAEVKCCGSIARYHTERSGPVCNEEQAPKFIMNRVRTWSLGVHRGDEFLDPCR
jgi:hypothetical protein